MEGKTRDTKFALLALPQATPLALYGLYEVFQSVGRAWLDMTGEENTPVRFSPAIVARSLATIPTAIGIEITPQAKLGLADVVIVPDIAVGASFDPRGSWPEECAWLRECFDQGAIICSVCTGSLVLAEAGLINGQQATCHWASVEQFKKFYPSVNLAPERILSTAGEADRIVTSGGASSWEDLALYLVARFAGGQEAVRIAKIFLFGERAEGQLMYAGARTAHRHADSVIADAQSWIAENYHESNIVGRLARRSNLNERTFNRRFRAATGYTPIDYVQTLRIEEAKQLLETTGLQIDEISEEVGYANPSYFRKLFRRRTGVPPARYRQRFSPIALAGNLPKHNETS
ncbi:GlxA family transcriptional regulator [Leisingera sp. ANG-S5]|uniref:GlxA family transcriptional regulator n=1 Tax=Leisingera sp. ANG-S5 TaxID=1577901 RepID=UPI00057F6319|nr:helix-turn-helix domain-containing protein [Leisingera sp. ANG-S5]KIC27983.1 transcriptional regulator [Leisingera sp. ANG-S5]